jgi:DNA-directed RNA polymerase specialized sigma subunit
MASDDTFFRQFAISLERAIGRYGDIENFNKRQQQQLKQLIALEDQFRHTLIKHSLGERMYKAFVRYINVYKHNILAARPFFRERQKIFTRSISKALKTGDIVRLHKFRFNFTFIQFVLGSYPWKPNSKIVRIAREIVKLRWELVTLNLPLAISRARIFFSRTPRSHLEYMDFIDIACEGLMNAIDKYVPSAEAGAFPSVAIQRMTGNFIEEYSETKIHFYPVDKRKIYRANKILGRNNEIPIEELVEKVNLGVEKSGTTNSDELTGLLSAQSCLSIEVNVHDGEESVRIEERFEAPRETQPDVLCEQRSVFNSLSHAVSQLSLLEQKILKLRGVSL